jgi:hypothetical protein
MKMKNRVFITVFLFFAALFVTCSKSDDPAPALRPSSATFTLRNKTYSCNQVVGGYQNTGVVLTAIGPEGSFVISFVPATIGIKSFEDASVLLSVECDGVNFQNFYKQDCPPTSTITIYTIGTIKITSIIKGNPGSVTGTFEGKVATTKRVDLYSCGDGTFSDTQTDIADVSGKFFGLFY